MRRLASTLAITTCLLTGFTAIATAQNSLPGLTIFSGVKPENRLPFKLDFGGNVNGWDRYRLRIPPKKLNIAVAQFAISYPDYYRGKFDTDDIEVRLKDKKVPIQEVNWNKENRVVEIYLQEPVPANSRVELVFSNVKNPPTGGMFNFNCQVQSPGDVPLLRYVGTWTLSIG